MAEPTAEPWPQISGPSSLANQNARTFGQLNCIFKMAETFRSDFVWNKFKRIYVRLNGMRPWKKGPMKGRKALASLWTLAIGTIGGNVL